MRGRKNTNNNKKKKKKNNNNNQRNTNNNNTQKQQQQQPKEEYYDWNFYPDAGPGCYITRHDFPTVPEWMIGWEDMDDELLLNEEIPEIAIDPDERSLTICNSNRNESTVAYVTIYKPTTMMGRNQQPLKCGTTTTNDGISKPCITFIVLCPPKTFAHLAYFFVAENDDLMEQLQLESDIQVWNRHLNPTDYTSLSRSIGFPLKGGPFLCTQGVGGQLTHFFAGNQHAIDFRCPIGTPLLAVGNGVVVDVKDNIDKLTGIAVTNLFEWNSIMIQLLKDSSSNKEIQESSEPNNNKTDSDLLLLFVEYVHIQKSTVQVGDVVQKGQVVGYSGSVGFSPEPHLHFAVYRSKDDVAPTVGFYFEKQTTTQNTDNNNKHDDKEKEEDPASNKTSYIPRAGCWYDATGLVEPPPDETTIKKVN